MTLPDLGCLLEMFDAGMGQFPSQLRPLPSFLGCACGDKQP